MVHFKRNISILLLTMLIIALVFMVDACCGHLLFVWFKAEGWKFILTIGVTALATIFVLAIADSWEKKMVRQEEDTPTVLTAENYL